MSDLQARRAREAGRTLRRERIWVTWETQRRNATVARALGCTLFEFDLRHPPIIRYPVALALTFATFLRQRPRVIFVQNPSMVLAAFAVTYGKMLGLPVVVDAHNAAIEPLYRRPKWQAMLARFILRHASLTIVSNQALAEALRREPGLGTIAVLPDPVPDLRRPGRLPAMSAGRNVLYMCSWAEDEPYLQVIEAARLLPSDVRVYITGKSGNRLDASDRPLPPNVTLTGYVDEQTYVGLLHACDVVLDLTTWQNCLLCGAYEAVAAERPMVLSGTAALRAYFHCGAIYTDNTPSDIANCIGKALSGANELLREIRDLKNELARTWKADREGLEAMVRRLER